MFFFRSNSIAATSSNNSDVVSNVDKIILGDFKNTEQINQIDQNNTKPIFSKTYDDESNLGLEVTDITNAEKQTLQKGLSSKAIQFIALGGAIGTGLFVGTSSGLSTCGPAGLLTSYLIMSTIIYPIMNAFGEMVCFLPSQEGKASAGSAAYLVEKYVDQSLGFATSWNYYYCYIILTASECSAASGVVEYWTVDIPKAALIAIFIIVIVVLNCCPVKYYGETEFWFASVKILCIIGLILVSFILFWGGGPKHDRLGFRYWQHPGAFAYHITTGNTGRFLDVYSGLIKAGFAYILGPELVALTSSECEDQRRNIAKASKRFVYRLIFFYCLGVLSITVIVAYDNPVLQQALRANKPGAGSSPFVIGIVNAGISVLPHIINVCILMSAWSAGNAFMFASTRSLLTMAHNGFAPKIFGRINRWGVPYVAVAFGTLWCCLSFLNVAESSAQVFSWFSNISTISGFIGWSCSCIAYLRFRRAIFYNDLYDRLPFKSPFQPYSVWYSFIFITIIAITNGYAVFIPKYWNVSDFIAAYITLPVFFVLLFGHKIYTGGFFKKWYKSVEDIDVTTGLDEIEFITKQIEENRQPPKNKREAFLEWLL